MRKVALSEAVGLILAHDITKVEPGGFKGVLFPRGHRVAEADLPLLRAVGKNQLYVYEPEVGLWQENDAAERLGQALAGAGVTVTGPSEAKVHLRAERDGLWLLKSARVRELNLGEGIRVAARADQEPVRAGDRLATIKVVPLLIPEAEVIAAAAGGAIGEVRPYRPRDVGIVTTGNEVYEGHIPDAFGPVLAQKLPPFGGRIRGQVFTPDDPVVIAQAILDWRDQGAELILVTGGLAVDPDDQTPGGIARAGSEIISFGVPVQPGLLLLVARLGPVTVLGLPSSVIHDAVTSFDRILPRVMADLELTREDLADLGVGGLL